MEKPKKRIIELTEDQFRGLDNEHGGYCLACFSEAYGVEPDARQYECEACGVKKVYGASELLLMGRIAIIEGENNA